MRSTVQQADHLAIAVHGHPRNRVLSRQFQEFDAHLDAQLTAAGGAEDLSQLRRKVVGQLGHRALSFWPALAIWLSPAAARLAGCRTTKSLPS